uniref:Immunoglobulin domain-containing protein n=1 Tax=Cyprinus carpio carpio TaxID=630221 RepID=A0A8C1AWD6_CYPCA
KPQPFFFHVYELVFALAGVLFCEQQRVFGAEVDMRVKAGDSITLYGDCVIPLGSLIVWLRNCSHEYQPSLFIDSSEILREKFPRFHFVPNSSRNSYDLHITNVSVSDEGVYYCAKRERIISKDVNGIIHEKSEYKYGNKTTRLSVLEPVSPGSERFNTSSTPPVSDCVLCWTLLFSVCPVCVLLFSICVYCFCQRKTTGDHSLLNSIPSQL